MFRPAKPGTCPECGTVFENPHRTINIEEAVCEYFCEYKKTGRDIDYADIIDFVKTLGEFNESS